MMDPIVERPRLGISAYFDDSELGHWSLAAQIVGMIVRLRSDGARTLGRGPDVLDELMVPALQPIGDVPREWREWDERLRPWREGGFPFLGRGIDLDVLYRPGRRRRLDREASVAAFQLFFACLNHPAEIVRTVAAAGVYGFLPFEHLLAEAVLAEGCLSGSTTIRTIAADSLARVDPEHPALQVLTQGEDGEGDPSPMHTSILVHGTWARYRSDWWHPGSEFYEYIRQEVAPDLYTGTDYFRWTGSYSGAARGAAAADLGGWLAQHSVEELNFAIAHSHGGNVVLDAAATGVASAKLLVLLHVPATPRPSEVWDAIKRRINRIVCLRSRFDLVVALDGGGHRFAPHVRDLTVPRIWFSHDAMLNPKTWESHRIPRELAFELGMASAADK